MISFCYRVHKIMPAYVDVIHDENGEEIKSVLETYLLLSLKITRKLCYSKDDRAVRAT